MDLDTTLQKIEQDIEQSQNLYNWLKHVAQRSNQIYIPEFVSVRVDTQDTDQRYNNVLTMRKQSSSLNQFIKEVLKIPETFTINNTLHEDDALIIYLLNFSVRLTLDKIVNTDLYGVYLKATPNYDFKEALHLLTANGLYNAISDSQSIKQCVDLYKRYQSFYNFAYELKPTSSVPSPKKDDELDLNKDIDNKPNTSLMSLDGDEKLVDATGELNDLDNPTDDESDLEDLNDDINLDEPQDDLSDLDSVDDELNKIEKDSPNDDNLTENDPQDLNLEKLDKGDQSQDVTDLDATLNDQLNTSASQGDQAQPTSETDDTTDNPIDEFDKKLTELDEQNESKVVQDNTSNSSQSEQAPQDQAIDLNKTSSNNLPVAKPTRKIVENKSHSPEVKLERMYDRLNDELDNLPTTTNVENITPAVRNNPIFFLQHRHVSSDRIRQHQQADIDPEEMTRLVMENVNATVQDLLNQENTHRYSSLDQACAMADQQIAASLANIDVQ